MKRSSKRRLGEDKMKEKRVVANSSSAGTSVERREKHTSKREKENTGLGSNDDEDQDALPRRVRVA
jgi:hypothetical protein